MKQRLVIGYGNTLRRDDGVGVKAAEAIDAMSLPGVKVITRHQLVPELAMPISEADEVIFVDADITGKSEVALKAVEPADSTQIMAHAANPSSLLALAKQVFGNSPRAWALPVPVCDLGFGSRLSSRSRRGLRAAVKLMERQFADLPKIA